MSTTRLITDLTEVFGSEYFSEIFYLINEYRGVHMIQETKNNKVILNKYISILPREGIHLRSIKIKLYVRAIEDLIDRMSIQYKEFIIESIVIGHITYSD